MTSTRIALAALALALPCIALSTAGPAAPAAPLPLLTTSAGQTTPVVKADSTTRLRLDGAPNFRDIGGYRTADGKTVRRGRVYRSGQLSRLTESDYRQLAQLHIAAVCDFRRSDEKQSSPTRWPATPGAPEFVTLANPAPEKRSATDLLASGADAAEASRYLLDVYEKTVTTYAPSFKTTFRRILDSDDAVLYHCSAGKDRTGIFTALLLTFLGVPRATVVEDYLRSNAVVTDEQVEAMAKRTKGQPAAARIILSVDASYLQLAFATIDRQYGSLDAYRRSQLGLSDPDVARLKARLLE